MTTDLTAPTAERTLRLIELLLARSEGWTPQELLVELDLSRSSLFVLLRKLKTLGYVEQTGKRGRYVPGPRLQAWRAPSAPASQDLLTAFYQECTAPEPQETIALVLPAGREHAGSGGGSGILIAAQVEGSTQVRSVFTTGQAHADLPAAAAVLTATPSTGIAENGYSLSIGPEAIDLALPICRDGRTPDAALLLSAPAFRWTADALCAAFLDTLRDRAAHLSYRLGAPFYAPYQTRPRDGLQSTAALFPEEIAAFLKGPWAASLGCIRPDGRPHVIPVWQEWDGQAFYVIAWRGSQWADYLLQNANVSLTVDEPWAPLRRVVVQGSARPFLPAPAELDRLLGRMTRRYLGQPASAGLAQQIQQAFQILPVSLRGYRGLLAPNPAPRIF